MSNFIDLHAHSTFSLRDGFGTPKQMVERAVELGWNSVSITEHGHMMSAPALYKAARAEKLNPIIGCELYVTPDFAFGEKGKELSSEQFHLTVLALSMEGYQNLVAWTTEAMQRENFYRKPRISIFRMAEVARWPLHHNVVLSGCLGSELNQALLHGGSINSGIEYIQQMKMVFPNFYVEIQNHKHSKFMDSDFPAYLQMIEHEQAALDMLIMLAEITDTPLVLTNDSHMPRSSDRKAHVAMKASDWRNRDDTYGSTERVSISYLKDYIYFTNYLRDMERVAANGSIPQSALQSVADIAAEADIRLEPLDKFSYSLPSAGREDPVDAIRRRIRKRVQHLLEKHGEVARLRIEHELESMQGFADYLLLMSDFILAARKQGILTWTRGSAANSLLCYALGIHEIDSIEYGLIFSRFFNPARKKFPDIDIDIQPSRYDDFMRIVQEQMEPLIGKGQVVQVCNYGTAANRSAFRMAASALGIPKEEQDEISKLLPQMIDSGMVDEDTDVFIALREDYPELYEITSSIFDSVKSVSQHACAWVFGTPDRKLSDWVPMYLIASSGVLVTQYDFKTLEDFGLVKGDFLRLKTLDVAANVLRLVGESPLEFFDLPLNDPATYEMIREGHVEGVHTLQGKEVRRGVVAMEAENVHDLITAAALYRPANTRESTDKIYVARRNGTEIPPAYSHPLLEEILGPTHGIPVFQEQAMELGYAVGMDDAGVDDLYQAIKKAKGQGRGAKEAFEKIEPDFMAAAEETVGEHAEEFWHEAQKFQGYGFNKGHASSYGVLADKMAYLKCHHAPEFFASILDAFPQRSPYLAAARAEGFDFVLPDVNRSESGFVYDREADAIRVGLGKIHNLGPKAMGEILEGQPFTDYDDFKARTTRRSLNVTRLENLANLGALESFGVKAAAEDDAVQFQLLGFTLRTPKVFKGVKPKHTAPRESESGWKHRGRERGLEMTGGRASVSKLFWIPPGSKLELKASPWAQVKTWLLTVLDENGVQFHLMVNENKPSEVKLLNFLHRQCQGAVLCADGMVRLPFVPNSAQGFRFFGITGAFNGDPQIFGLGKREEKFKMAISELDRIKRMERYK